MKQGRIELRASREERERLLEAAQFAGTTLSAFLRQAALEKSDDILKSRDHLKLTDRDRDLFLEALENPPKPNRRLREAFNAYKKRKGSTVTPPPAVRKLSPNLKKRNAPRLKAG